VSSVQETHADGPQLVAGLPIYVDYAYINDSDEDIADRFLTDLLVDGLVVRTSSKSGLDANHYGYGTDREITVATPGWHSIALMVDKDDAIGEFNEVDNYYERQFYVEAPPSVPNLTPYQPSSWDDEIVVSSVTDTRTDGPSLVAGQPIYVDYAYLNDSDTDIPETFLSEILIDGSVVTVSSKSGLQAHYYGFGSDREFILSTPGWHSIAIRVDKDDAVDEYNEDDNYYERSFYLEPPGTAEPDIHVYPTVLHIYKE
jgi:subtilase family serine protease